MNINYYIKCDVCEYVTHIKVQAGYIDFNPFSYYCPKCGISISGNVKLEHKSGKTNGIFVNNGSQCESTETNELIQISSEFYTDKLKNISSNDITNFFSPFIINSISNNSVEKYSCLAYTLTQNIDNKFNISDRIWQLYKTKKLKYLKSELIKFGIIKKIKYGNFLKMNHEHFLLKSLYKPFLPLLRENNWLNTINKIENLIKYIKHKNYRELKNLKIDLKPFLEILQEDCIWLIKNFTEYYKYILPVIISETYKETDINKIKIEQGIMTTNFEDLKNYYVEAFEILCNSLVLFLGLQNIYLRNNRNTFNPKLYQQFSNIKTLSDFQLKTKNKGNKIKFFIDENIYKEYYNITKILNNNVRNSIGHYSYKYDTNSQLITFNDRNSDPIKLYLIEFANILYKSLYGTLSTLQLIRLIKCI